MPVNEAYDEQSLLRSLTQGDEAAFVQIFHHYRNRIFGVSILYLKSTTLSEEIVQEVFMKVWFKRRELNDVRNFEAWLMTLAKNHILNYLRKMASERSAREQWMKEVPLSEEMADHKIRKEQYAELMRQAMDHLSPQQREVYGLAREEQLTYEDIGKRMGISALTVKTHMARALQAIREFLRKHGEPYLLLLLLSGVAPENFY